MKSISNLNYINLLSLSTLKANDITLIIIGLLVFLHLLVSLFFIYNYLKIIVPQLGENRTAKRNLLARDVCEKYCQYFKLEPVKVSNNVKYKKIYNGLNNKGEIHLIDYKFFSDYYYLSALNLDYILGRLFYWTEKRMEKNRIVARLGFWLYQIPRVSIYGFYIFIIILIIFNNLVTSDSLLLWQIDFFNFMYRYNVLEIIVLILFTLYAVSVLFNSHFKSLLENEYEKKVKRFVREEFSEIYPDWIIARGYARSVTNTYTFGFSFIYKKFFKYTGPFSL